MYARITAPERYGLHTVGPMMNPDPAMILFVPDVFGQAFPDPSYHLATFYELWSRWGPEEDRAFWAKAAGTSRAFFVKTTNVHTGLAPSYANFEKQILRPAYPANDCVLRGAPNARVLRMTLNLLNELCGGDIGVRRECLEAGFAPGTAAGGFYADAGAGFEFAGAFAGTKNRE